MKNLLFIPIAALTLSASQAATSQTPHPSQSPAASHLQTTQTPIKAVRIYADWCPKCKVLDAQLKTLRASNEYSNVEFIYLDYTEKDPAIFYEQAKEFGIEEQVKAAFGGGRVRTGQMFIFDAESDELIKTITHTMSDEELTGALTAQAAS